MASGKPESDVTQAPAPQAESSIKLPKLISFDEICRCGDEVWIENEGQIYRLRRTKLGKLILTK